MRWLHLQAHHTLLLIHGEQLQAMVGIHMAVATCVQMIAGLLIESINNDHDIYQGCSPVVRYAHTSHTDSKTARTF